MKILTPIQLLESELVLLESLQRNSIGSDRSDLIKQYQQAITLLKQ